MICSAGAGGQALNTLREDKWVFVQMYMACNHCGSNGRLSASFELKKTNEPPRRSHRVKRWRGELSFFWLLGFATVGSICFLLRCDEKISASCEKKAQILLQHSNVSNNQLQALAAVFSESDQIVPLKCSREQGSGMPLSNSITCALKVLCTEKQSMWLAENIKHKDQCPVQDSNIPWKLEPSVIKDVSFDSQSAISPISPKCQNCGKNIYQTRTWSTGAKDHFWSSSICLFKECWWVLCGMILICIVTGFHLKLRRNRKDKQPQLQPVAQQRHMLLQQNQQQQTENPPTGGGNWRKLMLVVFLVSGIGGSISLFCNMNEKFQLRRDQILGNMCDERARMLQDQFNVSMNHVHALAILVSTFHHQKHPSAIDQKTFSEYTERTDFERPLTSGVAYALKVLHSEREQFEKQHGWTIKKMETEDQTLVQDCTPENLDPAPIQDEYAPVIFSQETVSHIVSIDMMSGKEDRENILRARASGKGVLTSPFKLLKSNHLGVVLTFAVYSTCLPPDASLEQRIEATVGYLGASYDVPSLVEKLLRQLASEQTIFVNVYDTTNASAPINMYGTDVIDTGLLHIRNLDFGDPSRKHEMHCRFEEKSPLPWTAINSAAGVLVITLLLSYIFLAAIKRITEVENDYHEMMALKARAEAADVAKSQFLATVSHEIRTPMNGVLGMLQMLMDTDLNAEQLDYAQTAHNSGKDLISLINDVLDQAKIESGRLELETVPFHLHDVLDNVLSLFSSKCTEKGIELAIYVSDQVPEVIIGDPGRFRQIITNLVGNSIKFTEDKGHIFVSVHLADEVRSKVDAKDQVLLQGLDSVEDKSEKIHNTLSGFPVVDRWKSWENFKMLNDTDTMEESDMIKLLVTVEDTGVGIPLEAQARIFTPFMQADSSTSRTYGGTGIGLSISHCLVELMGGQIGFVSEPHTGSTFSFTVTFQKGERISLDPKWQQYVSDVSKFQGLGALVIDDRSIRAVVTRYHLQRLGMYVHIATNMQSACAYLSDTCSTSVLPRFSMILIDKDVWNKETASSLHYMLKQLRQKVGLEVSINLPKVFLLATTISPDECDQLKCDGILNLLMKPLRLSVLIASLQEDSGSTKKLQIRRKKPTLGNLLRGKQILVVDDNSVNRRVAEGALKKHKAIVTCVDSGKAAVEKLKPPHNFDACFMDLQMPEMDGFEATQRIRSMEKVVNEQIASGEVSSEIFRNVAWWHIPILAMTADVIQASNEQCMNCGMNDYVSKPFEDEQLYAAAARFFESD